MRINWKKVRNRIPTHIMLNRKRWEIVWTEDFYDGETLGETRYETRQIVIKSGRPDKETVHTYIHEMLHALQGSYGAGLTENQVQALEVGTVDLIRFFGELLK